MKKPAKKRNTKHEPINATFTEVLGAIARSKYKDAKTLKKRSKKK